MTFVQCHSTNLKLMINFLFKKNKGKTSEMSSELIRISKIMIALVKKIHHLHLHLMIPFLKFKKNNELLLKRRKKITYKISTTI